MNASAVASKPRGLALAFGWRRLRLVFVVATLIGLLLGTFWVNGPWSIVVRVWAVGAVALAAFGLVEQWPARLPRWIERWVLQVLAVGVAVPATTFVIWTLSTESGAPPFWTEQDRLGGFAIVTVLGILLAPWFALGALVRQKEALARHQALAFELERSEFARQALDARLRLLQAQVAPHFLFNTLANVQALVDTGSPQASSVLRSLVAYLRAAVPRLDESTTTLAQELQLVRAYLELMHMRMPDRLSFAITVDDAALGVRCPPMTLLTLVENAVRHGIDPSEDGGRIEIAVRREGARCRIRVADTGAGLREGVQGLGTGLATLRERLQLLFGASAELRVGGNMPRGAIAELELPAQDARS